MKPTCALLLASLLVAASQAAPAPVYREPRTVPAPEKVLARLRAEGLDVSGLMHRSGSRWVIEIAVDISDSAFPPRIFKTRRTIIAPGDPTDNLREVLRRMGRGPSPRMQRMLE